MNKSRAFLAAQMSAFIAAVGLAASPTFADTPSVEPKTLSNFGCRPETLARLPKDYPPSSGMTIDFVACLPFKSSNSGTSEPIVSPTNSMIAQWHNGAPAPLEIAGIMMPNYAEFPNRVGFRSFGYSRGMVGAHRPAVAWSDDGESLWTVRQDVLQSGFGTGGLIPIKVGLDGISSALPSLHHDAGPLDALQWVGGKGLALAQFGTKGGYYRPQHLDTAPTYAIVDGRSGTVRANLPASSIPEFSGQTERDVIRFAGGVATATTLPDGKVRAIFQFGSPETEPTLRVVWTEGSKPQSWRDSEDIGSQSAILITPDGSSLLINRRLQPEGVRIFDCVKDGRRIGECGPPPTPVSGPIAELVDVASRQRIWQVTARASVFWNQDANPAISPDGRLALIALPPEDGRRIVGLIAMEDGRMVDRFAATYTGSLPVTFGFMSDGAHAWLMCGNLFVRYRITAKAD